LNLSHLNKQNSMIYNLPVANILNKETIMEYDFNSEFDGWEIISNEDEKSFIKDGCYWMENKSKTRWMFYHKELPVKKGESFLIKTEIELLQDPGFGQFGLVWGFDKPHNVLNRFTISSDMNRFTICKFQKDHERVLHRFSNRFSEENLEKNKYPLSILLLEDYYYFFIQPYHKPIYMCHKNHLSMEGFRFGFYIEPGIIHTNR